MNQKEFNDYKRQKEKQVSELNNQIIEHKKQIGILEHALEEHHKAAEYLTKELKAIREVLKIYLEEK